MHTHVHTHTTHACANLYVVTHTHVRLHACTGPQTRRIVNIETSNYGGIVTNLRYASASVCRAILPTLVGLFCQCQ